jgi:hypothetical protein
VPERDPALPAEAGPGRSQAHWVLVALAPACLMALVVLGTLVTPSASGHGTHTQLGLPPCLSIEWLGVPCPGCGVTTATALAAHGRLLDALHNQPLGLVVAALLALYPLWVIMQLARGRDLAAAARRIDPRLWVPATIVLILGAWVYKLATGFPA